MSLVEDNYHRQIFFLSITPPIPRCQSVPAELSQIEMFHLNRPTTEYAILGKYTKNHCKSLNWSFYVFKVVFLLLIYSPIPQNLDYSDAVRHQRYLEIGHLPINICIRYGSLCFILCEQLERSGRFLQPSAFFAMFLSYYQISKAHLKQLCPH